MLLILFKRDLASVIHALAASHLDSISAEYLGMKPSACRTFQLIQRAAALALSSKGDQECIQSALLLSIVPSYMFVQLCSKTQSLIFLADWVKHVSEMSLPIL